MVGFGGDPGFGMGYGIIGLVQFLTPLLFLIAMLGVLVQLFRRGWGWNKNNHSPRLTVPVTLVEKRSEVHRYPVSAGKVQTMHTSTSYYATFQVESGDRMEFEISDMEYGMLAEGDRGMLTFQGTRYLNFRREGTE